MNASPQSEVEIERLVQWIVSTLALEKDVTLDDAGLARVRELANEVHASWSLRRTSYQALHLPFLAANKRGPVHLDKNLSAGHIAMIFDGTEHPPDVEAARAREAHNRPSHTRDHNDLDEKTTLRIWVIGGAALVTIFAIAGAVGSCNERHEHEHEHDDDHNGKKESRHH